MSEDHTVVTDPQSNNNMKHEESNTEAVVQSVEGLQFKVEPNAIPSGEAVAASVPNAIPDAAASSSLSKKFKTVNTKKRGAPVKTDPEDAVHDNNKASISKKPRVTPERAQAVADKIRKELVENYVMGIDKVQMDILAPAVGYKHPRSDAILAAVKILKEQDVAVKSTGNQKQYCGLTAKGIDELVPQEEPPANNEAALEKAWSHLETKLAMVPKTASDRARDSALSMWNLLKTGEMYTKKQLLDVTHYGMERSTGFPETLKALLDLGITEKKDGNSYRFTDKMFPFGRPEYLYDDQKASFPLSAGENTRTRSSVIFYTLDIILNIMLNRVLARFLDEDMQGIVSKH
eukprot:scaffold1793_cov173-Amphora_coffeaeformis.AAC.22